MSIEFFNLPRAAGVANTQPVAPFSSAVRAGDFIYVSGQVPRTADGVMIAGDIEAQTRQTLDNLQSALSLAGCTLTDVVKVTVWLTNAKDIRAFNAVYERYFGNHRPARSATQASLVVDADVEIEAIAYKPVTG